MQWQSTVDAVTGGVNSTAQGANCDLIAEYVAAIAANGISPGVYASPYMWEQIPGSDCSSSSGSSVLWYANWDGETDFSDYSSFGGWASPAIKQYNDGPEQCGFGVDWNWYPD